MKRFIFFLFISTFIACKAKTPYNPYLKAKEKPSTIISQERKQAEKSAIKKSRRQLRKNRKTVLSN